MALTSCLYFGMITRGVVRKIFNGDKEDCIRLTAHKMECNYIQYRSLWAERKEIRGESPGNSNQLKPWEQIN